jgi:hypothetical protein
MSNERAHACVILTATLKARNLDNSVIERVRVAVAREWLLVISATRRDLSMRRRQQSVPKM